MSELSVDAHKCEFLHGRWDANPEMAVTVAEYYDLPKTSLDPKTHFQAFKACNSSAVVYF